MFVKTITMNLNITEYIPQHFDAASRVWVYQSSRLFTVSEAFEIEKILNDFVADWRSHGIPVKGYANLLFGQFIIIMADEKATGVSGCSTDSSVRAVKQIEQHCKTDMFNRQTLAFIVKDKIQLLPLQQLTYAFQNGFITANTLYFNNLVATKQALLNEWIIPLNKSWLANRIKAESYKL